MSTMLTRLALALALMAHSGTVDARPRALAKPGGGAVGRARRVPGGSDPDRCTAFRTRSNGTTSTVAGASELPGPVFWLHVPKAGTSFGLAIAILACPDLPGGATIPAPRKGQKHLGTTSFMPQFVSKYDLATICPPDTFEPSKFGHALAAGHVGLKDELATSGRGLMLVRDPRQRLYSAFRSLHADGMPARETMLLKAATRTVEQYATTPGIAGCQVKMLTGRRCAELYSPTLLDLREAKARLRTGFAFVGLTDHYDLSICLFHAMFGGAPRDTSFLNTRPTAFFAKGYAAGGDSDDVLLSAEAVARLEPLDTALYAEARRLFVQRLTEHGLAVPSDLAIDEPQPRASGEIAGLRGERAGRQATLPGLGIAAAAIMCGLALVVILIYVTARTGTDSGLPLEQNSLEAREPEASVSSRHTTKPADVDKARLSGQHVLHSHRRHGDT